MASKRKTKKTAKKTTKKAAKKTVRTSARKSKAPARRGIRLAPKAAGKPLVESRFTESFTQEFLGPQITCKWMANQDIAAYLSEFAALVGVLIGSGFPPGSGVEVKDTPAAQRLRQIIQAAGWPTGDTAQTLNDILLCIAKLLHCLLVRNIYSWPPHTSSGPRQIERWPPHT